MKRRDFVTSSAAGGVRMPTHRAPAHRGAALGDPECGPGDGRQMHRSTALLLLRKMQCQKHETNTDWKYDSKQDRAHAHELPPTPMIPASNFL